MYALAIRSLRIRMKENQKTFSKNIGITQSYLSQLENDEKQPSTRLLQKMSDYTKIPMPIIIWDSLTAEDIKEEKRSIFLPIKYSIDALIEAFL